MSPSFIPSPRTSLYCVAIALCLLLASLLKTHAQSLTANAVHDTPQATVTAFYSWYLNAIASDHVPLKDNRRKMQSFVSAQLLDKIVRNMKNAEADEDYFTRAQDYFDDWKDNIAVSNMRDLGKAASVVVTLGNRKESQHALGVDLVKEGDSWKISHVGDAPLH